MSFSHPPSTPAAGVPPNAATFDPDLLAALRRARHVVVFTGAGVSAESGIPTFRDALTGLWSSFDPMRLATPEGFLADPDLVWGWYEYRRLACRYAQPNPGHQAIAQLAARVPRLTLVTQNVDDLHERAGSHTVLHLHGSLHTPRCFDCATPFPVPAQHAVTCLPGQASALATAARTAQAATGQPSFATVDLLADGQRLPPPRCPACGGAIRPGVVWFGEALPPDALDQAFNAAEDCDVLLSVGTSGVVEPAAGIPRAALRAGAWVAHVNPQSVPLYSPREVLLRGASGVVLPQLLAAL